jgi:hypothetical protein
VQQTFAPSTPVATGQLSATPHPPPGQDGSAGYDETGRLDGSAGYDETGVLCPGTVDDASYESTAGAQLVPRTSAPSGFPQADPDDEQFPAAHAQVAFGSGILCPSAAAVPALASTPRTAAAVIPNAWASSFFLVLCVVFMMLSPLLVLWPLRPVTTSASARRTRSR